MRATKAAKKTKYAKLDYDQHAELLAGSKETGMKIQAMIFDALQNYIETELVVLRQERRERRAHPRRPQPAK